MAWSRPRNVLKLDRMLAGMQIVVTIFIVFFNWYRTTPLNETVCWRSTSGI